jgi:hypothetical protein
MVNLEQHEHYQVESLLMMQNYEDTHAADYGVAPEYQIPDEMWIEIEPLLPALCPPKPKKLGRPRMSDR